jgi:hypothetical protein
LGRAPSSVPHATVFRSGPQGPRRFAGSVRLPNRQRIPAASRTGAPTVEFRAYTKSSPRPSLMTRIGRKLRGAAAL